MPPTSSVAGVFASGLDGRGAVYRQLVRVLRQAIAGGRLVPGTKLPPTRWVAAELAVARNRVVLAYSQLQDEGYLEAVVGSGTFVAADLPHERGSLQERAPKLAPLRLSRVGRRILNEGLDWTRPVADVRFDLRSGRPNFDDFPRSVWARIVRRHAVVRQREASDYPPAAGLGVLRAAIAEHLERWRGVSCLADQVVVVNGSQQALSLAAALLTDIGDRVVLEEPHYIGARQAFETCGVRIAPVPVDEGGLDTARLPRGGQERLAYVTPSHQFPTGAVLRLGRRRALIDWAVSEDAYVIEDDYNSEYRYSGSSLEPLVRLDATGRVLFMGSFSKLLLPSLRLGYLVLPQPLVRVFTLAKLSADLGSAYLTQRVLADFIREGHFDTHLRRVRRRHGERRRALLEALRVELGHRVEVHGESAGLHILAVFPELSPGRIPDLIRLAREREVRVDSTTPLYLTRPTRAEILIGHGTSNPAELREAIRRLAAAYDALA